MFSYSKNIGAFIKFHTIPIIAKPIVRIQNGWLTRTDIYGIEFEYDISNQNEGKIEFYDVEPNDQIDFYFSINNYYTSGGAIVLNQVKMRYTLITSVHLKRLTAEGEIEEYYVVGNRFLVSDDADEQKDMDGSNFSFYYSKKPSLVNNPGAYTNVAIDKSADKINSLADLNSSFYSPKSFFKNHFFHLLSISTVSSTVSSLSWLAASSLALRSARMFA